MVIHFSILAWRIPWTGVPGRLHSIRSQRVRRDWSDLSCSHAWMWEFHHKEGWAPKNWCFQIVVLEKTLESPLDCKEIQPSILKEISPNYSLEGRMLKYFDYLMRRANSLEKTLMLGKVEGKRRGQQRVRWLDSNTNSMDMNFWEMMKDREAWHTVVHSVARNQNWLGKWTTTTTCFFICLDLVFIFYLSLVLNFIE